MNDDVAMGTFLLHVLADAIGMRVVVFRDASSPERAAMTHFQPKMVKYSGALLVSVETAETVGRSKVKVFRSVEPRDALCARSTANVTDGQRRRDARDAERRKPGARAPRDRVGRKSSSSLARR